MADQKRRSGKFLSKITKTKEKSLTNLVRFARKDEISITSSDWKDGRRVVEIKYLADNLKCTECTELLHLKDIQSETVYGLGSILHILCIHCENVSNVCTGKRHASEVSNGPARCFDVNTKLAAAMLNAGVGEQQINNILAELNIPTISHTTLKKREREIGKVFEDVSSISCDRAIDEEMKSESGLSGTSVSIDGGWQRRGTGLNHNSMSGHVTMIGKVSRKCLNFGVAKKTCRTCQSARKFSKKPRQHSCRKNWSGSSKSMESYLAIKGLQDLQKKGVAIKRIIMDDDTTTFSRAKKTVSPDLIKCSDKNHVIKNFTNKLYKIKEKNKLLSSKTINSLKKNFSYAISQNKDDKVALKQNINAIVPHAFGKHEVCSRTWCKFYTDNEYKPSSLPFGRYLEDSNLEKELSDMFSHYSSDVMVEKLSNLESSNANENMNQIISRKAPKSSHFSGSESLDYRVSAAVAQKNDGHSYILQVFKVNTAHGLSPGKFTEKRFRALDKKRDIKSSNQRTVQHKRRRLQIKESRNTKESYNEVIEGQTYLSGVSEADDTSADSIERLPTPLKSPSDTTNNEVAQDSIIIFDLETTGLGIDANILQIAAKHKQSGDTFNTYIYPKNKYIPLNITKITGIELQGGVLLHNWTPVEAVNITKALNMFNEWLSSYKCPLLVAHNANFDSKVLMNTYKTNNIPMPNILGFADSLKLFKTHYPGLTCYKQCALVKNILNKSYEEHNAIADVDSLTDLLSTVDNIEKKLIIFTCKNVCVKNERILNEHKYLMSYDIYIEKKIIAKSHAKSIAASGLSIEHLQLAASRSGIDGLTTLMQGVLAKPGKTASCLFKEFSKVGFPNLPINRFL